MTKRSKYMGLIMFLALLALFSGTVSAVEWNVEVGGSVQAAVNTASNGDTIIVNDNNGSAYIYNENIVINKNISLQSKTGANVAVQALNSSKPVITVNSLGSGSLIQGFTITGATNSNGILLSGTSNCNIQNNTATNNRNGIFLYNGASNNIIQNNLLTDNSYTGILINYNANTNIIQNSIIQNNILTRNYYGIYLSTGSNNSIVQNNTITNSTYEGILVYGSVNNIIHNNTATNNRYGILLSNSSQNNAIQNNIATNNQYGIFLYNGSSNNLVQNNVLTDNSYTGILINYNANTNPVQNSIIQNNILTNNYYGIYLSAGSSDSIVRSNIVTGNQYGVYISNSSANVNFNKISGNSRYGLYKTGNGTVNATNNWWGSNTDPSTSPSNIYANGGTITYNPWIVLNVNASTTNSFFYTYVTADLTHNNQGNDTSSQGHIPNNLPVNFNTTLGTIISTAYTVKGKATTILDLNTMQTVTTTVTASTDNQSVSISSVISTGSAIITITSTASDFWGDPVNITYTIPLNDPNQPVLWVSVLWKNIGAFQNEVELIVNGVPEEGSYMINNAFDNWQGMYRLEVFAAISYANTNIVYHTNNPEYFLNDLMHSYFSLTAAEWEFVQEHRLEFIDNLTVNIIYPGVANQNITIVDAANSTEIDLNFPGNVIQRTSQITYAEDNGSGYEGVRSFAIAKMEVDDLILDDWLLGHYYEPGAMKAAYGTFLNALMMIFIHDQIAYNVATEYDITWGRTSPAIVSVGDEAYQTYITLECDHSMGITAVGTTSNMWTFNNFCSAAISFIEYALMDNIAYPQIYSIDEYVDSVTLDLINGYMNNNTATNIFTQNGFLIMSGDNNFLLIDLETGIVRDINTITGYCGAYCFHDELTTQSYELGEDLVFQRQYMNLAKPIKFTAGLINYYTGGQIATGAAIEIICAPELTPFTLFTAAFGISEMALGAEEVWSSAFEPMMTNESYEEQIQNWPSFFI